MTKEKISTQCILTIQFTGQAVTLGIILNFHFFDMVLQNWKLQGDVYQKKYPQLENYYIEFKEEIDAEIARGEL